MTELLTLGLKERTWDRLLGHIFDGEVVPVIGSELLILQNAGKSMTLYRLIAEELCKIFNLEMPVSNSLNILSQVAHKYTEKGGELEDIYFEINRITKQLEIKLSVPSPLVKLAQIGGFDLFISLTFDSFLQKTIDEIRFGGKKETTALFYSCHQARFDSSDLNATPKWPVIFQLFGRSTSVRSYVVTDEDMLEFNHRLQKEEERPQGLFRELARRQLLILGCSFPDWLSRFFFCATKSGRLFDKTSNNILVADTHTREDTTLNDFLMRHHIQVAEADAVSFVDELHDRWIKEYATIKRVPGADPITDRKPDSVFISYAYEDREKAQSLQHELVNAGIDAWFDIKQLNSGEKFEQRILKCIMDSPIFIPLISKNTVSNQERRFFRLEWAEAIKEGRLRPSSTPFIHPLNIDHIKYDNENIPHEFKQLHWTDWTEGSVPENFKDNLRRIIRTLRKERVVV